MKQGIPLPGSVLFDQKPPDRLASCGEKASLRRKNHLKRYFIEPYHNNLDLSCRNLGLSCTFLHRSQAVLNRRLRILDRRFIILHLSPSILGLRYYNSRLSCSVLNVSQCIFHLSCHIFPVRRMFFDRRFGNTFLCFEDFHLKHQDSDLFRSEKEIKGRGFHRSASVHDQERRGNVRFHSISNHFTINLFKFQQNAERDYQF